MFDYNQRPQTKEFSKGYEGIKWDKDKILSEPIGPYFSKEEEAVFEEAVSLYDESMINGAERTSNGNTKS